MYLINKILMNFIVELLLGEFIFTTTLKRKDDKKYKFIIAIIILITVNGFIHLNKMVWFLIGSIVYFGFTVAIFYFYLDEPFQIIFFICTKGLIAQKLAFSLCTLLGTILYIDYLDAEVSGVTLLYLSTFGTIYFLLWRLSARKKHQSLRFVKANYIVGLNAFILILLYVFQYSMLLTDVSQLLLSRILAVILHMFCLTFFEFGLTAMNADIESEQWKQLLQLSEIQMRKMDESIQMINIKYHDLKHQIQQVQNKQMDIMQKQNIEEITDVLNAYSNFVSCGSRPLDIALTEKEFMCKEKKIHFTYMADGRALDFMKESDIYLLFCNALDNAIEAVEQEIPEKRIIVLSINSHGQFLSIVLENYCSKNITFCAGLPVTTKEDKQNHGYGVKSIEHIVEKYHGTLDFSQENSRFCMRILFYDTDKSAEN